ncbi:MAG: lectin like domain-containing protein [Syntrophobacteraceae bacterium]
MKRCSFTIWRYRLSIKYSKSGYPDAGYHTVLFFKAVPVRIGANFSVVVAVVSPDSTYPYVIALRMTHSRYDDRTNAIPGKNYISADGNKQLYPIEAPGSSAGAVKACVKAFESRSTMWIVRP